MEHTRKCPNCSKALAEGAYCGDCFTICLNCLCPRPKDGDCPNCAHIPVRNKEDAGLKFDADKLRLDLLPIEALEELSKVYAYGVKKYSAHNWRKGMAWSRLFAACLRHLFAWYRGEDQDQESELSHLIHAAFCIMCLITFTQTHPEKDDRPHKELTK